MTLPAEVGLCTIRGRYVSAELRGGEQESVPLTGLTVTFTPTIRPPMLKGTTSTPPVSIVVHPVTLRTNADGVLVGDDGSVDVSLIASDYPDPENPWTYRVNIVGPGFSPQEFSIVAPTGAVLDLTEVLEAPSGAGFDLSAWSALVVRAEAAVASVPTPAELNATYAESLLFTDPRVGGVLDGGASDQAAAFAQFQTMLDNYGGRGVIPKGQFRTTAPVPIPKGAPVTGAGVGVTEIVVDHAGNGFEYHGPIGPSNPIRAELSDMRISGGSTGSGVSVFSAAIVDLHHLHISGFDHSVVLEAVTHGDIDKCTIENPITTGIWIANGSDYRPGYAILPPQNNRISIRRNNIRGDSSPAAMGVVDDGGWAHEVSNNSFEGFGTQLRVAGVEAFVASNNEYESAKSGPFIVLADTSRAGTNVGGVISATLSESVLDSPLGYDPLVISGVVNYLLLSKINFHSTGPAIKGLANVNSFYSLLSRNWGTGALTDGSRANGAHNVFTNATADIDTATIRNLIADATAGLKIGSNGGPIGFWGTAPGNRRGPYAVSNPTALRNLDGSATSATTHAELVQVVGRLITDLKAYGLLG